MWRQTAYFAPDYNSVADIRVNPGGTAFQQQVWSALRTIPVGTTVSYDELAAQLGDPKLLGQWG